MVWDGFQNIFGGGASGALGGAVLGGGLGLLGGAIGGKNKPKYSATDARGQLAGGYRFNPRGKETSGITNFAPAGDIQGMFGFNPFYQNDNGTVTSQLSGSEQQRLFALQQLGMGLGDYGSLIPQAQRFADQRLAQVSGQSQDAINRLGADYNAGLGRLDADTNSIRQNFASARQSVNADTDSQIKNRSAQLAQNYAARGFGSNTGLLGDITNKVLPEVLGARAGALANIENAQAGQLSGLAALRAQLSQQQADSLAGYRFGAAQDRTPDAYFSQLLDLQQQPTRLRTGVLAQPGTIYGSVPTKISVAGGNPNAASGFAQNAGNILGTYGGQLAGYGLANIFGPR